MTKLLKLNPLLLFLYFGIPYALRFLSAQISLNSNYFMIISIANYTLNLIWFLYFDEELTKRIPVNIRPDNTFFLICSILLYLTGCVVFIFFSGKTLKFTGLPALGIIIIGAIAIFVVYDHLSKLIVFAEQKKEIETGKRIGEMVLFFFFLIGIWWLQPRIIKIMKEPKITHEKYIKIKG